MYSPESSVRKTGSYIYEEFMPTDGTDVKVLCKFTWPLIKVLNCLSRFMHQTHAGSYRCPVDEIQKSHCSKTLSMCVSCGVSGHLRFTQWVQTTPMQRPGNLLPWMER